MSVIKRINGTVVNKNEIYKKFKSGDLTVNELPSGFRWLICSRILSQLSEQSGFDDLLKSGYFSNDEIEYIIFNMDNLEDISKLSFTKFIENVNIWKKKDNV